MAHTSIHHIVVGFMRLILVAVDSADRAGEAVVEAQAEVGLGGVLVLGFANLDGLPSFARFICGLSSTSCTAYGSSPSSLLAIMYSMCLWPEELTKRQCD